MNEIKPAHHVTKEECQEMIDDAIRQHNRNASIISMFLGITFLALFVDGFFRVIGMIPPFMGIDVNILHEVIDRVKEEVFRVLPS
jgi:predicted nucleic acid-binding Zn ribbon protein|tara:strand:+ start:382 stop:636 length:255 start_codon:yes stop_codon:yes gene_type:complete